MVEKQIRGGKKLTFINQNLIYNPESNNIKQRVRYWLYRWALHCKNFQVTVNSPALVDFYAKVFHCSKEKFHVVYDSMDLSEAEKQMICNRQPGDKPYVFFGGKAFRDVDTFLKVVKLLPDVKFKAVVLKEMLVPEMESLKNLEVYHDIKPTEFYEILNNASICCIPLKASVPCGVSVMQKSILMNIPIVSTDTMSMRTIVPDDEHGYLLPRGDTNGMAQKIELLLHNPKLCQAVTAKAKANMANMTEEAVGKQICEVLEKVIKKSC